MPTKTPENHNQDNAQKKMKHIQHSKSSDLVMTCKVVILTTGLCLTLSKGVLPWTNSHSTRQQTWEQTLYLLAGVAGKNRRSIHRILSWSSVVIIKLSVLPRWLTPGQSRGQEAESRATPLHLHLQQQSHGSLLLCSPGLTFLTSSYQSVDDQMSPFHKWRPLKFTTTHTTPQPPPAQNSCWKLAENGLLLSIILSSPSSNYTHTGRAKHWKARRRDFIKSERASRPSASPSKTTVQLCATHAWGVLHSNLEWGNSIYCQTFVKEIPFRWSCP